MRHSKKLAALAIAAGVAITASAAFAYWTTSGSGTGAALAGTSSAVTVTQVGSISGLAPGSPAQAVDFSIDNTASTNQYIASVAVSFDLDSDGVGGPDTGMTWNQGCSAADFTIVQPTAINADLTPGLHGYSPSGASLKLDNRSGINQDGCKNQAIVLALAAS